MPLSLPLSLPRRLCSLAVAATLLLVACGDDGGDGGESPFADADSESDADKPRSTATTTTSAPPSSPPASEAEAVPGSVEGAISRFEEFLHALGRGDLTTICEIAGPAAQEAEAEGFGPCEDTYGIVLDMIPDDQAAALETATIDSALVTAPAADEVFIPVSAVVSSATFTESDLGSYLLRYQDGNWFIVE